MKSGLFRSSWLISLMEMVLLWKVMCAVDGPAIRRYAGARENAIQMHSLLKIYWIFIQDVDILILGQHNN